jgi:hypothetical protein
LCDLVSSSTTIRPRGKRKGKRTEMKPTDPVLDNQYSDIIEYSILVYNGIVKYS